MGGLPIRVAKAACTTRSFADTLCIYVDGGMLPAYKSSLVNLRKSVGSLPNNTLGPEKGSHDSLPE